LANPVEPARGVVLYSAQSCHLCDRAREVLDAEGVVYTEVDITGDPELEAAYREWIPVVEIDGARAFVYHVQSAGLRRKLGTQSRPN
jgi:glutaredoxin